jgi:predicted dienelactone hydrolase
VADLQKVVLLKFFQIQKKVEPDVLLKNSETEPAVTARYGPALRGLLEGSPRSNSHDDAPISVHGKPFPLLLFSPGLGGAPYDYSIQMEGLASHGYIVVAMEHVNDTFGVVLPDGKVVPFDGQLWNR